MVKSYVKSFSSLSIESIYHFSIDPYKGPGPGPGTGPHRYIFFLYQSTNKILEKKIENDQRLRFTLENYITENCLELLKSTYCLIENP